MQDFPPLLRFYLWRYHKFKVLQVVLGAIMTLGTDCEELLFIFFWGSTHWVIALQLTNSQLVLLTPPFHFSPFPPPPLFRNTRDKEEDKCVRFEVPRGAMKGTLGE